MLSKVKITIYFALLLMGGATYASPTYSHEEKIACLQDMVDHILERAHRPKIDTVDQLSLRSCLIFDCYIADFKFTSGGKAFTAHTEFRIIAAKLFPVNDDDLKASGSPATPFDSYFCNPWPEIALDKFGNRVLTTFSVTDENGTVLRMRYEDSSAEARDPK